MRLVAALVALALVLPATARADCEQEVAAIDARLARSAHKVKVWRWSWGIAGTAGTAGQLVAAALVSDRDARIDLIVGGVSTVAVLFGVVFPVEIETRADPRAVSCPDRLADAARRQGASARAERAARAPIWHVANVAYNLVVGLILGLGYHHWVSGAINFAAGTAVGEAQLLTIPGDLVELRAVPAGVAFTVRF